MKPIAAVLILMLSVTVHADDLDIEQDYYRFDDETGLSVDLGSVVKGSDYQLKLMLMQHYEGKGREHPTGPPTFYFYGTSKSGWRYLKFHRVVILAGDERFRFEPDHRGDIKRGYVLEELSVHPDPAGLQRMAKAAKIEGVVGADEFVLKPEQLDALRAFARYLADPKLEFIPAKDRGKPSDDPGTPQGASDRQPTKTGVLRPRDPTERYCNVLVDLRLFDELDQVFSRGILVDVMNWESTKLESKQAVPVPKGTQVEIVKERKRLRAIANPVIVKVVVLEGRMKGVVGWCPKNEVVVTATATVAAPKLGTEKEADAKEGTKKAETKLRMAQGLEKAKKPKAALDYYRELMKEYPGSAQAKIAADRVKALEAK